MWCLDVSVTITQPLPLCLRAKVHNSRRRQTAFPQLIPAAWLAAMNRCLYDARAAAAGVAFCFTAAINVFAAGPEEAGFCPVISKPSLTT